MALEHGRVAHVSPFRMTRWRELATANAPAINAHGLVAQSRQLWNLPPESGKTECRRKQPHEVGIIPEIG